MPRTQFIGLHPTYFFKCCLEEVKLLRVKDALALIAGPQPGVHLHMIDMVLVVTVHQGSVHNRLSITIPKKMQVGLDNVSVEKIVDCPDLRFGCIAPEFLPQFISCNVCVRNDSNPGV